MGRGVKPLLDVHQQNLVELGHCFGSPVIALHQLLTGAHQTFLSVALVNFLIFVAKGLGDGVLQIEDQTVFTPIGHQVQTRADQQQHRFVALNLLDLKKCR